jgi:quercetin dioxygenase-like cupin family protein
VIVSHSTLRFGRLPGRETADPLRGVGETPFSVRIVRLRATDDRSPHRHPFSQEFIYVIRGRGTHWQDGEGRPLGEGDSAIVAPGVAHATVPDPGTSMELVCFFPHPDLPHNSEELREISIRDRRWVRAT